MFFKIIQALIVILLATVTASAQHKLSQQHELDEVIVSNKRAEILLKPGNENVIDYAFVDDSFLVASHNMYGKRTDKLFLLDNTGQRLLRGDVTVQIESIFRSCVGRYYVVSYNAIYPIYFRRDEKTIVLGKAMSLNEYAAMKKCVLQKDDYFYYKLSNPKTFSVAFYLATQSDPSMKAFKRMSQPDILKASIDNLGMIYEALASGDSRRAAQLAFLRKMLDKAAFQQIDADLFAKSDSLVIFDFDEKQIHFFTTDGRWAKQSPILFPTYDLKKVKVLQDFTRENFYLLNDYREHNELTQVNIATGDTVDKTLQLEESFIENIKIKDGNVYYVWQKSIGLPKRLFIDKYSIKN